MYHSTQEDDAPPAYYSTRPDQGDDVPATVYEYIMIDLSHMAELDKLIGNKLFWIFKTIYAPEHLAVFICIEEKLDDPLALGMFLVYVGPVKKRNWTTIQLFSLECSAALQSGYGWARTEQMHFEDPDCKVPCYVPMNKDTLGFCAILLERNIVILARGEEEIIKRVTPAGLAGELLRLRGLGIADIRCRIDNEIMWIPMN